MTLAKGQVKNLIHLRQYMNIEKCKIIVMAFTTSHFDYCPLVWMLHNSGNNTKTIYLNNKALWIEYGNRISLFQELLKKVTLSTIHNKGIQILTGEMLKTYNRMTAQILNDMFKRRIIPYNVCNQNNFEINRVNSVKNGTETLANLGPKL